MARNLSTAVYSGSLRLDKITGLRADKKRAIPAKSLLKQDISLPQTPRSTKTTPNEKNGAKY